MTTATAQRESRRLNIDDCPIIEGTAAAGYKTAVKAAGIHSTDIKEFLEGRDPKEQAAWMTAAVSRGRDLFQPWNLEILFLTAIRGTTRFSELETQLGISSRTLSNKLRLLTDLGLLDRKVHDEQPVRIEYACTRHGRMIAALTSPLFSYINIQAMRDAGRDVPDYL